MNKLFFLHIPKTAGTSFIYGFLEKNVNEEFYYDYNGYLKTILSFINKNNRDNIQIIGGHYKYGLHKLLWINNYEYIVFLRSPIDRVISHYNYIRNLNSDSYTHPEYDKFQKYSILELLESSYIGKPISYTLLDNLQVRYLAGFYSGKSGKIVTEKVYKKALKNLNNIRFVCLTEYYEESVKKFADELGFEIFDKYRLKSSINKNNIEINEEEKKELKKYHEYDIRLYKFIKKKLRNYN